MAKTKENTDVSQRSPSQPREQRLCLCVVGEGGVWVRVGSLAACLGEHCHHLQAVLVEVSPCFDPKPKRAIPFHLPVETVLKSWKMN